LHWKGQKLPSVPAGKVIPSAVPGGREPNTKINPPGNLASERLPLNPFIGRKVMTRWPDDNSFYEAVITDYNPVEVPLISYGLQLSLILFYMLSQVILINVGSLCTGL
jgi:hypothetical protein